MFRHLILVVFGVIQAIRKAADPVPPYSASFKKLTIQTFDWLLPINHLKSRKLYSITSITFHIGLILVPIFLSAHILLWRKGIGFGWPAIDQGVLDILTLLTIAAGVGLFIGRIGNKDSRYISRLQDYLLTWLLIIPFISGYLAMNPHLLPVSYTFMMIIHVLSGELVFVLMPFSKISHCILFPLARYASNYAWRFVPNAGEKVARSLGKEVRV
ncbi:hypothetical protein ACFL6G_01035 [candidate division KSB1 bacterium]